MRLISLLDLEGIMREFAWEGDWQSFAQAPDDSFEELGYDSLALLETHTRIGRDYGVRFTDDDFFEITTPRGLVEFVNAQLAVKALAS